MRSKREHSGPRIQVDTFVGASPAEVYEAWADPQQIAEWFVDRAEGRAETSGQVLWEFEYFKARIPVPVVEAIPGRRLVFAGEVAGRPAFLQEFDFEPEGDGTRLSLVNSGFGEGPLAEDERLAVESGWILSFATLRRWIESYRGQRRFHHVEMRPATFEFDALQPLYSTIDGLLRWLCQEATATSEPLVRGATVHLRIEDDRILDGEVLARSDREVLLDWPQCQGVLALKCFTMYPGQRAICLDFNAWSAQEEVNRKIGPCISRALSRLVNHLEGFHDRPVRFKGWSWPKPGRPLQGPRDP